MPLICFASPKGGVGKTMLVANVGYELQRLGWQVLVIDLDSQNALRLHFAMPLADRRGLALESVRNRPWEDLVFETSTGVLLLPFGGLSNPEGLRLQSFMRGNRGWLRERITPFLDVPEVLVLVDLPPGRSIFLEEIAPLADLELAILLSDATSIAVLPTVDSGEFFESTSGERDPEKIYYVLNQVDIRRRLRRDVLTVLTAKLGDRLTGVIYRDEAVQEAIGAQRLVADYAPDSKAAHDIAELSSRLDMLVAGNVSERHESKVAAP